MEQYVIFKSHEQLFALPVKIVKRVVEEDNFITLPEVPAFVLGAYEFQKHMVPVIDLRAKLFKQATAVDNDTKVILCNWKEQSLGLLVENIVGITALTETNYEDELAQANLKRGYMSKFLKMDDNVVVSLDLEYLFDNRQEKSLLQTVDDMDNTADGDKSTVKKGENSDGTDTKEIKVSIADYKLASSPDKMLTVGLGSCVGTFIYDERVGIGGLSHIMLPDSKPFVGKGTINPAKFADLALPAMVAELKKRCSKQQFEGQNCGGANMFNFNSLSANGNVGQRNIQAVKEMLQALQIPLLAEHVGGKTGRTMIVDLKDFKTMVRLVHSQIVYI